LLAEALRANAHTQRCFDAVWRAFLTGVYVVDADSPATTLPRVVDFATELHPGAVLWDDPHLRVFPLAWASRASAMGSALMTVVVRRDKVHASGPLGPAAGPLTSPTPCRTRFSSGPSLGPPLRMSLRSMLWRSKQRSAPSESGAGRPGPPRLGVGPGGAPNPRHGVEGDNVPPE
jgi:hypothetical protein